MNVLYCGDGNIKDGVLLSVISLLKNVNETLNVYLLTASVYKDGKKTQALSSEFSEFLDELVKKTNSANEVTLIDISDEFLRQLPDANMGTRFTPCCMLRLYSDDIKELPDKILYLDNDVICRQDPDEYYNQNIDDYELAGTLDYYGSWFFYNIFPKRDYINSGVLLLNLKKIRETGLFKKCREMCTDKKMFMPDQSAINKLCNYKKICSRNYNEQRKLRNDTVFQHFTTSFRFLPWFHKVCVKPWNVEDVHKKLKLHAYDDILNEYLKLKIYMKRSI